MKSVNPEMLVLARELRGLTQAAVATRTGIVQATVSKYENGTLDVSADHLEKVAEALALPVSFFRQQDRAFGSMCLHHRKRQGLSIKQLRQIHAKFNVVVMQVRRLLKSAEVDCSQSLHPMPLDEFETPEKVAAILRGAWKLPLGPIRDLTAVIERAGGIIFQVPLDTDSFDALSIWAADNPPFFFVNENFPADRLRFSLAHELGHLIMHTIPTADQEREADRFASEFLMPAGEIRPQLSKLTFERLATLKSYWRVSMQALIKRAHTVGAVSDRQLRTLLMRMSAAGWRKKEPVEFPPEKPTVVSSLVDVHLKDCGYTVEELCEAIHVGEDDFRRDYLRQKLRVFR